MIRDFVRKSVRQIKKTCLGHVDLQELLDRNHVKMAKTKEYLSDDKDRLNTDHPWGPAGNVTAWSYRFTFDNQARKRAFMNAVKDYPPQPWDTWIRWMDDISNFNGEVCIEAHCRIPEGEEGKFRYQFEDAIMNKIIIKV